MTAERAAHLTNTVRSSPSLFEVISAENLAESVSSAFEHLFQVSARNQPKLGSLAGYSDEIYLIFDAAVQYHYIKTKGGTLSEAFYGLERLSGSKTNFFKAYLSAVLVPYFRLKLDRYFEKLSEVSNGEDWRTNALLKIHHYYTLCLAIVKFYCFFMYAMGRRASHSFLLSALNLRLSYVTPEALNSLDIQRTGLRWILFTLGNCVLPILEIGSFTMQFLQWWQAQEKSKPSNALPVPEFYEGNLKLDKSKCPLCAQNRRNNTALSTSGIVFCYTCINRHLEQSSTCPITSVPSKVEHLIRIYDE